MDSKRILIIGKPKSGKLTFVKALTGTLPRGLSLTSSETSHAGLTHEYTLRNKYFQREVGIWIDEYTDLEETLEAYASQDANEVMNAISVIVYTFRRFEPQEWSLWNKFSENLENTIPIIGLHMDSSSMTRPPESLNPEYVVLSQTGKNEFGEMLGFDRVLDIFNCCEWDLYHNENTLEDTEKEASNTVPYRDSSMSLNDSDLNSLVNQAKQLRALNLDVQERKKQAMSIINSLVDEEFQESDLDSC
ncbi:recombination protein Irc6 [Schizosaccharomyces cryophilus OY26]|uniref:Recombination protein Irc6 n=1 Tax=Schizosaccharomyces cryophilus (strain OY26 / ATCC MYA-4695 / CBS 11777 / NBRC 106824 / NRRL Y48691) TaxID=653667 RepID=S9W1L4_SCHCR|nr:recombination protein Irc6 [Schizosaccharomyces cryophilus OY26]EPY51895.1 recombination protein Irc6 [Schizosaccharomyces cryophilus OY26]